ncbi:MAG TPA: pirin family protein, partial [Firmicutes bacterium]|nr:pirin family protein [Bacillota bacterium]
MIKLIKHADMGKGDSDWVQALYHFSFSDYYNPSNISFGKLRVLNDDLIEPGTGFDTHPHANMEIISYVVSGELTHGDSMGNKKSVSRGNMQYMSAGTGIWHSEHNYG